MKRGQVTVFIIIGMVVVAAIALLSYMSTITMPSENEQELVPKALKFNATNTLQLERKNEIVKYTVELNDNVLLNNNTGMVAVYGMGRADIGEELVSDTYNFETYPSGFVKQMTVVFQDDFSSGETKTYLIGLNELPALAKDINVSINSSGALPTAQINNFLGNFSIIKYPDEELNKYELAVKAPDGELFPLITVVPNNILRNKDPGQGCKGCAMYLYEKPELTVVESNKIFTTMFLNYSLPKVNGPSNHNGVTADATITLYRNSSRIDMEINYYVSQKFYNHNGFKIGAAVSNMGNARFNFGKEWNSKDGNSEYLFNYYPGARKGPEACMIKTKSGDKGIAWKKCNLRGEFDRYYVMETANGKSLFAYLPVFEDFTHMLYDGSCTKETIWNTIGGWLGLGGGKAKKEIFPASGYLISYGAKTGVTYYIAESALGCGWVPVAVPPRTYTNRITYVLGMKFSDSLAPYNNELKIITTPLIIEPILTEISFQQH